MAAVHIDGLAAVEIFPCHAAHSLTLRGIAGEERSGQEGGGGGGLRKGRVQKTWPTQMARGVRGGEDSNRPVT